MINSLQSPTVDGASDGMLPTTSCSLPSSSGISSLRRTGRVISRFSCGAASAVATKLAIEKYGEAVEIYYTDTGSEHPDNIRFVADCEKWFGRKVNVLKSTEYESTWDVFERTRFLVSNHGARCTGELKRKPGDAVWRVGDVEIYGYTADEGHRLARWQNDNTERIIECPLIDKHLDKADCLGMLERVGIELPAMYRLGFSNNNCIGCVKARDNLDYWKRIRLHFPEQFARMANLERELSVAINRKTTNGERNEIYLDEIEAGGPTGPDPKISCGLFCMAEADALASESQREVAGTADEKPDGQADNTLLDRP
jgi:3'-phosphoadenosine 5'-phosphosulfate sulfotransferase (PAPS reductase)/FAD synthetase